MALLLVAVLTLLVLFAAVYVFFVWTRHGQRLDDSAWGIMPSNELTQPVLHLVRIALPVAAALLAFGSAVDAVLRRRSSQLLRATILVAASAAAAEGLKILLPRPDYLSSGYDGNTFPSGHVALTVALFVAACWLRPQWLPAAALFCVAVLLGAVNAVVQVVGFDHRLSDVLGAPLLVAALCVPIAQRTARVPAWVWCVIALVGAAGFGCLLAWAFGSPSAQAGLLGRSGMLAIITASVSAAVLVAVSTVPAPAVPQAARARGEASDAA